MGKCAQCGNNYDQSFEVTMGGRTLTFDSFECAIAALAPVCPHCGCRIIGHGVQHGDTIYCCVHCAKHDGVKGLVDREVQHCGRLFKGEALNGPEQEGLSRPRWAV
jgi:nitrite reductase/ring-hydroxylating ferredoxin subunit